MFMQIHRFITAFLFVITPFCLILGCGSDDDDNLVRADTEPPAAPRDVRKITGNGLVTIEWCPNSETDLAGYYIWRDDDSDDEFELLEEVSSDASANVDRLSFVDKDVTNGHTYSYAVSAVDHDGNESELSPGQGDTEPPAMPRGVRSITGDGLVTIEWFPNSEADLAGYSIWRDETGDEEFDLLGEVSSGLFADADRVSFFVDKDVINGRTYSYAVSAFDYDGNESELSTEQVFDTPRPSGNNITLNDFDLIPNRSGFDFSQPEKGAIAWDSFGTDIYFGFVPGINIRYLFTDNFTEMQDMGYHEYFDEVDVSPVRGFVTNFIELIEGHVYALLTPDGNFAKIHVTVVSDTAITFDWAYQIDPGNPQLAPAAHEISDVSR